MQVENLGLQTIDIDQNLLKSQAKCINNRLSTLACNNSNCSEYAFVCDDKKCICRVKHKKCLFTDIDQIIQLIQDKRYESTEVIDKISTVLENWIDQISKTRQRIETILKDWGLSPAEKTFLKMLKTRSYDQLTGNHINQITTKTVQYFTEQTKQHLLSQIDGIEKNYDSQIKSIMNTVTSLFDKYEINQMLSGFKDVNKIIVDNEEEDLFPKLQKRFKNLKKPLQRQEYDNFVIIFKEAIKTDFSTHMKKYKKSRRVYGTKKLRQKYFEDYFTALNKGEQHVRRWEVKTKDQITQLNKFVTQELMQFCNFYRESDGAIEKPFTSQSALSLQKTINTIYMLVDFIKLNGKNMIKDLYEKNKRLTEKFEIIMYFLDALMDTNPEIDEIETVWNVIKFEDKIKSQVNYLYEIIQQTLKDPYELEVICIK